MNQKPFIFIFTGPPLSGKGMQSRLLGEKLNLPVFSIGQILRDEMESGNSEITSAYEEYAMQGRHLPIAVKFPLLKEKLLHSKDGFILENFPATQEDLTVFTHFLTENNLEVTHVFHIVISIEEMIKRMKVRNRIDDTEEILLKRRKIQDRDRIAIIDYYKKRNLLTEISGEHPIEVTQKSISAVVDTLL